MEIYNEIKVKPYSYVLIDNKADTAVHRQILSGVFGICVSYALPSTSRSGQLQKWTRNRVLRKILQLKYCRLMREGDHC